MIPIFTRLVPSLSRGTLQTSSFTSSLRRSPSFLLPTTSFTPSFSSFLPLQTTPTRTLTTTITMKPTITTTKPFFSLPYRSFTTATTITTATATATTPPPPFAPPPPPPPTVITSTHTAPYPVPPAVTPHSPTAAAQSSFDAKAEIAYLEKIVTNDKPTVQKRVSGFLRDLQTSDIDAQQLYNFTRKTGSANFDVYDAWIARLTELGRASKAQEGFDSMKNDAVKPNLHTFNNMIRVNCKGGFTTAALDTWKEMERAGVIANYETYHMLIDHLCNSAKQVNKSVEVLGKLKEKGVKPTLAVYGFMIEAFAKLGRLFDMNRYIEAMEKDGIQGDTALFSKVIYHMNRNNSQQYSEGVYQKMKTQKIPIGPDVYEYMIEMCARRDEVERGLAFYNEMTTDGLDATPNTYAILIEVCRKTGKTDHIDPLYENIKKVGIIPSLHTYNSVIDTYVKTSNMEKAEDTFAAMKANGVKPDINSYTNLLNGCGRFKDTSRMMVLLEEMQGYGIVPDQRVYGAIITHTAKNGDIVQAEKLLKEVEDKNMQEASVYNPILDAYAKVNDMEKALGVRQRMRDHKIKPTIVTYCALLHSYVKLNKLDQVLVMVEDMKKDEVVPSDWSMKPVIKAFNQAGMKQKAEELKIWSKTMQASARRR